jgi:MFS family permease
MIPFGTRILLISVFFDILAVGLVVPLLPFVAERMGARGTEIGLLSSIYGLAQLVGGPVVGRLSG